MLKGRLHSTETFGAVDGPGIRTVFFLQGCPARCVYCHNPDTWTTKGGRDVKIEEVVQRAKRGIPYYGKEGGVTFSGGEPLMQGKFLLQAIKSLKANGIGSAIDTSGTYFDEYTEEAIKEADLILLDIKHTEADKFQEITSIPQEPLFQLIQVINKWDKDVWIRQVILPGINDTREYIDKLNRFIRKINSVKKVELLGYHNMAIEKYDKLGISYSLRDMKPMEPEKLEELKKHIDHV
ncbi:MAG: pyruvate formate-lyase-activating protein [Eubacteriales bacterium]|jgi:pyruvate formate lyase activating enzyme|nr:pyruvate formate-lyase-activating protein [Eubacteriales bacterium]